MCVSSRNVSFMDFFSCRGAGELGPTEKRARNRVNIEITLFFFFERVGDWLNAATVGVNC
jgi:hypothetical protein